jgi:hypothetical protein
MSTLKERVIDQARRVRVIDGGGYAVFNHEGDDYEIHIKQSEDYVLAFKQFDDDGFPTIDLKYPSVKCRFREVFPKNTKPTEATQVAPMPDEVTLQVPTEAMLSHLKGEVAIVVQEAKDIVVRNDEDFKRIETIAANSAGYIKEVAKFIEPYKKAAKAVHSNICALESSLLDEAKEAKSISTRKVGLHLEDMERQRRKEQAAADEAARLEKEKEEREETEMLRKVAGDEVADAYKEEAAAQPVISHKVDSFAPTTRKGTGGRKNYSARVVDESLIPLKYRPIDMKLLNSEARQFKEKFDVEGAKLVVETTGVVRGGK